MNVICEESSTTREEEHGRMSGEFTENKKVV